MSFFKGIKDLYRSLLNPASPIKQGGAGFQTYCGGLDSTKIPLWKMGLDENIAAEDGALRAGGTRLARTEPKARP